MPPAYLRDADELITPAVAATLDALELQPQDEAAAKLARYYALEIDRATVSGEPKISAWAARNIAPLLLQALESLGATPAARAAITKGAKGGGGDKPKTQLDIMRENRARKARA